MSLQNEKLFKILSCNKMSGVWAWCQDSIRQDFIKSLLWYTKSVRIINYVQRTIGRLCSNDNYVILQRIYRLFKRLVKDNWVVHRMVVSVSLFWSEIKSVVIFCLVAYHAHFFRWRVIEWLTFIHHAHDHTLWRGFNLLLCSYHVIQ